MTEMSELSLSSCYDDCPFCPSKDLEEDPCDYIAINLMPETENFTEHVAFSKPTTPPQKNHWNIYFDTDKPLVKMLCNVDITDIFALEGFNKETGQRVFKIGTFFGSDFYGFSLPSEEHTKALWAEFKKLRDEVRE